MYGEALVREAIICSLEGKVAHTICNLGHNASMLAMVNKLNTVYGAVVSYNVLIQNSIRSIRSRVSLSLII